MRRRLPPWAALILIALGSCARHPPPPSAPHAVLGGAYQAGGVWYYPHESYNAVGTGLATVYADKHSAQTADGETFDQNTLAAAHQTLQLPAIARVTNLETGRQVVVRLNDRGPPEPSRLLAVTRRTADLLGFTPGRPARVRLEVLESESHAAIDAAGGSPTPALAVSAAPLGAVQSADLPPPSGIARSARGRFAGPGAIAAETQDGATLPPPPLRMPETVTQTAPYPGTLWIRMGVFSSREYAARQAALVGRLGPRIDAARNGRQTSYTVRAGPFADAAAADSALDQTIRAGVTDARIVVEQGGTDR